MRLVSEGWSVKLLVRDAGKLSESLARQCIVVAGDLDHAEALCQAVRGVDVVFHCAANVNTWDSWAAYYAANVHGVRNLLLTIARENPALSRFVHVSTVDVYGFPTVSCDEACITSGCGFGYGETKLLGENLVKSLCSGARLPYTIIRPANVIGPGSLFIARIGRALNAGLMLKVDGGRVNAGLLYIDNLVDHLLWAATAQAAIGESYNVRDPYDVSWDEFLHAFRNSINGRGIIVNCPFRPALWLSTALETIYRILLPSKEPIVHRLLVHIFGRTCGHRADKIRSHSGIVARVGFAEAVERSAQWFMERKSAR